MTAATLQPERVELRPQRGPQERFACCAADVAIYGGAAGGGKSWSLLFEPVYHLSNPDFGAVVLRRTYPEITNEGGLWDESVKLYPLIGGVPKAGDLSWSFPSGASISFGHVQHETDVLKWQGSQVPLFLFDELTHFTEYQFAYLLSRNRSTCGVRPYVRATCNPDASSWVARWVEWYVDQTTGFPIPERAGRIRWFVRDGEFLRWADTKEELQSRYPTKPPKSFAFIPAKLEDNRILETADPNYRANLEALPPVERDRLLGGNWLVKPLGNLFHVDKLTVVGAAPRHGQRCRGWDQAATEGDGDWTVGVRLCHLDGVFYVEDVVRGQWDTATRNRLIRQTAELDGPACRVAGEQEPGSGGKDQARAFVQLLAGYPVEVRAATANKLARADPLSAQVNAGNVRLVRGAWNAAFIEEFRSFPRGRHDDQVDAAATGFNAMTTPRVKAGATWG